MSSTLAVVLSARGMAWSHLSAQGALKAGVFSSSRSLWPLSCALGQARRAVFLKEGREKLRTRWERQQHEAEWQGLLEGIFAHEEALGLLLRLADALGGSERLCVLLTASARRQMFRFLKPQRRARWSVFPWGEFGIWGFPHKWPLAYAHHELLRLWGHCDPVHGRVFSEKDVLMGHVIPTRISDSDGDSWGNLWPRHALSDPSEAVPTSVERRHFREAHDDAHRFWVLSGKRGRRGICEVEPGFAEHLFLESVITQMGVFKSVALFSPGGLWDLAQGICQWPGFDPRKTKGFAKPPPFVSALSLALLHRGAQLAPIGLCPPLRFVASEAPLGERFWPVPLRREAHKVA